MIKQLLQEGFILKNKGYYKHAIEAFYKALEIDNSSCELMMEIADTYYLMGDEERSLNYIEQALDKNPTHIESLRLLKKIFTSKSAYAQAEQTAKNIYCISNNDNDLAEIFNLLNKQGHYDEIFEYKFESNNPKIFYELAFAKLAQKEFSEAENFINKALEAAPENSKYLLLKGKILFTSGQKDQCIPIMQSLKIDNNDDDMLNFAGKIEQYQGNLKKALEYFKEAVKLSPSNDEYYYNCASTYFKLDDIMLAKKYYNLAISLNPDNQNYHFALANLYYSGKHYKRALEELKYDFFEAKLLKSIILYDTGYLVVARKELEVLAEEQPDNPIIADYKSRIEEELGI